MKFSVIVPIYNVETWITECLLSIKNQSFKDYEVLLIDDGSTDRSGNIAKKFATDNKNFFYHKKKNGGLSDARNYGILKSLGEFIVFIDSDDYIDKDYLKKIAGVIDLNPNVEVVEFNATVRSNKNKHILNNVYEETLIPVTGLDFMKKNIKKKCILAPAWLKAVNKDFIIKYNLFFKKGRLHEDELWTPQVYFYTKKIIYINESLYNYRIRDNSITQRKNKSKNIKDIKQNCKDLSIFYKNNSICQYKIKLLYDYLARQYMRAWSIDEYYKEKKLDDYIFLLRNIKSIKTLCKFIIFTFNINRYKKITS